MSTRPWSKIKNTHYRDLTYDRGTDRWKVVTDLPDVDRLLEEELDRKWEEAQFDQMAPLADDEIRLTRFGAFGGIFLMFISAAIVAAVVIACATAAWGSTSEVYADVLRVDCTQPGYFSVQVSTSHGYAEVRTGTGDLVGRVRHAGVHRVTVRDWHPVRHGHIKKLHVTSGNVRSSGVTTPRCGVVLAPEASDS